MASLLTASDSTWRALLPWLDRLPAPSLLALQELGGPVRWWACETPRETELRRAGMSEVFDLLTSFLARSPLADDPLSGLLPGLPWGKEIGSLSAGKGVRTTLAAFGKPTIGALGALSPRDILTAPLGSSSGGLRQRREVLLALVRAGSLPTGVPPETAARRPGDVPGRPRALDPGEAVTAWFDRLDGRRQDLIALHLCAERPVPLEELAVRHRTSRAELEEPATRLPQDFREAARTSSALGRAAAAVEEATGVPVLRADLLDRHPWLAEPVVRPGGPLVLDVLVRLLREVVERDGWLYRGVLADARQRTLTALRLAPGDSMPAEAAARSQRQAGDPVVLTGPWLAYCGLRFDAGRIERAADLTAGGASGAAAGDSAAHAVRAARTEPAAAPAGEAARVLDQLSAFAAAERPQATLAELLQEPDRLPPALNALVLRLLSARPGAGGWILPAQAKARPVADGPSAASTDEPPAADEEDRQPMDMLDALEW